MADNLAKWLGIFLGISLIFNLCLYNNTTEKADIISSQEEVIADLTSRNLNLYSQTGRRTGQTVYVTSGGTKYHQKSCSYISSNATAIDLYDAKRQGYDACSRCHPPK